MKRLLCFVCVWTVAAGAVARAQEGDLPAPKSAGNAPKTVDEKKAYTIGFDFGQGLLRSGMKLDNEMVMKGVQDALTKAKPALTAKEFETAMKSFQEELTKIQEARIKEIGEKNKKAGTEFLAANKSKPGVETLASGLQYKVLKSGKGDSPKASDKVKVNFRGKLIDGTEFDSTYARKKPEELEVSAGLRAWTEALQKMKVGDKWELYIPADMAFGDKEFPPQIGPNAVVIYELELLDIIK